MLQSSDKAFLDQIVPGRFRVVAIGASTGAPTQVEQIISRLPADLSAPILLAQHLPATFTPLFAAALDRASSLSAVEAENGMRVHPGSVYVGRGGQHLRVRRSGRGENVVIECDKEPVELSYKPSVDELLTSCARVYDGKVLAVVMTGIGRDGSLGAGMVKRGGGMVITQSADTCAVYGMPKACVEAGLSDAQLSPDGIRRAIQRLSPRYHKESLV